jgi:glucose-1-phosphate adenylyltransferase
VAWIASMQRLSGHITTKLELADQAFQAEVQYFDAPGGNMDHIACSVGGALRVDPDEKEGYVKLGESSFDLVLGDSNAPKDTIGILARCKFDRLDILNKNGGNWDEIDLGALNEVDASLVTGTIRNRDIERIASSKLFDKNQSAEELGELMCEHHSILRDVLKISTPKIEKMCEAAIHAGAVGAKIFGSGGGGCMIAMVPKRNGESNVTLLAQITSSIAQIPGSIATQVKSEPGVDWGMSADVNNPVVILAAGVSSRMKRVEGVGKEVANEVSSRPKAMLRVGPGEVPYLELLLNRIKQEGSNCVIVVIGENDHVTKPYFTSNPIEGLDIRYEVQTIPQGRMKPLGTADALETALLSNPDLSTHSIVVCNGDNMPPDGSFGEIFKSPCAMLAYDASKLGLPDDRVSAFAVVDLDSEGYLTQILEKPSKETLPSFIQSDGVLRVSMNVFKMSFSDFVVALKDCPMDAVRHEKELPTAIGKWVVENPRKMISMPYEGEFLDLTHPTDFLFVTNKLQ